MSAVFRVTQILYLLVLRRHLPLRCGYALVFDFGLIFRLQSIRLIISLSTKIYNIINQNRRI